MKIRDAVILVALTAGLFPANYAHATGNVLIPNDNPDKSTYPNLGLTTEPTPLPEPPKPPEAPKPEKTTDKTTNPAKDATPQPIAKGEPYPVQPYPTQPYPVQPYPAQPYQPQPAQLPYAISVSFAQQPNLSANDIDNISTQTGLPKNMVASSCRMGINGMIITDRSTTNVESEASPSVTVRYDGAITNAVLSVYAACNAAPNPSKYSYLQRVGNLYSVSLNSAFCQPKTPFSGTMRRILVTHVATGSDSCVYAP